MMVIETILIVLTGWAGISLSLVLSVIGIAIKKVSLCVAGALLVIPFAYYLTGSPTLIIHLTGLLLPLFQLGAAQAVREDKTRLAWLLLAPLVGVAGWLLLNVI